MHSTFGVNTFVGLDGHAEECAMIAIDRQGGILRRIETKTDTRHIRRGLRGLPGPVWVMLEASTMAPFIRNGAESVVDRVVVCETRENRLISKSESKDDFQDAHRLARLLRMGEFKEVYLPSKARQEIRELVCAYRKAVGDVVRSKNRIRCKYRERGIRITPSAYDLHRRGAWLKKIGSENIRFLLEQQYRILDASVEAQLHLARKVSVQLSRTREYRLLVSVPGLGPITVPIVLSIIDDPARFETKRKLWSYAGLGKKTRSSGRQKAKEGGSKQGCRLLKYAAMTAAECAMKGDNRFSRRFREMVREGTSPGNARKTIARSILATALAIWKSGIPYQRDKSE